MLPLCGCPLSLDQEPRAWNLFSCSLIVTFLFNSEPLRILFLFLSSKLNLVSVGVPSGEKMNCVNSAVKLSEMSKSLLLLPVGCHTCTLNGF